MSATNIPVEKTQFKRVFVHAFTVYSVTQGRDTGGAVTRTESAVLTSKGFVEPLTGDESIKNSKPKSIAKYRLFCLRDCGINITQRIGIDGKNFEVLHVADFNHGKNPHLEVYLGEPLG